MKFATIGLGVILLASSTASATAQVPFQCYRDEGCCIKGVQFRADLFPMCSAARKVDCIQPGKAFLHAAAKCKKSGNSGG